MLDTVARRLLCGFVLLTLCAAGLQASGPTFWVIASLSELLKGTSDGVYITLDGTVTAGPRLTNVLTSTPAQVWTLAAGADGTLWAGTGGDGRVIRVRPGQPEETVFTAGESNVFAIAVAGARVYAATGPDGRVYLLDGTSPARPFFDPPEKYIWALATDSAGRLWVGAGHPAVIYRVEANGTSRVVYRPPAAHVVCLTRDANGRMLAGTESPGRLYRFDADDRPFVLLESGFTELRAISLGPDGAVFAAATSRGDEPAAAGGETASVAAALPPPAAPSPATPAAGSSPPARRSAVFRIDVSGAWEQVWETPDVVYDIAAKDDGGVLVASGPDGRMYKVQPDRQVFLYSGVDARQITRLVAPLDRNVSVIATANPGRVVTMGPTEQSPATYISPTRDTRSASIWGTLRWEARGVVTLYTRSGNTEQPDDSWSDWSGPYHRQAGEAITSPPARFLQWKAVFSRPTAPPLPELTSVTVAYLPRNNRPVVSSITVSPPGVVFQRPFSSEDGAIAGLDDATADARRPPGDPGVPPPPLGRRMFQKGLQTIAWKAEDADGDHMTYSLLYRREGESGWRELRTGLTDMIFVWDTTTAPDGRYLLKVVASDAPSNAADRALTGERASEPIEVDNTPPVITTEIVRQAGRVKLAVHVHDAQSAIEKVEYSLGGGGWQLVYPVDGVADSPDERYEIPLANEADAARIVIRAMDVMQNIASQAGGGR
jgi:sugar lactone lactonase YvrE